MSLRSTFVGQFRKPQGPLGQVAGFIMATRPSNRERNAWTVGLLRLEPGHTVLEIGCGPGLALKACAAQVTSGRVVGIDHSEAMVRQARRRLHAEIERHELPLEPVPAICVSGARPVGGDPVETRPLPGS